jgi:hypothetical protein
MYGSGVWINNAGPVVGGPGWFNNSKQYLQNVVSDPAQDATGHLLGEWSPTINNSNLCVVGQRWAPFFTNVDVAGNIVPDAGNIRDLGTDAIRWKEHYGINLKLAPRTSGAGLEMTPYDLTDMVDGRNILGGAKCANSDKYATVFEATGRLARAHGIFDDFTYSANKWKTATAAPYEYDEITSPNGTIGILGGVFGGILDLSVDSLGIARLESQKICRCNPTGENTRINGFFRVALSTITGTTATARIALISTGTPYYEFGFEWSILNGKWRVYTRKSTTGYTYDATYRFTPSANVFSNFYCRSLSNTTVEFWTSGGGGRTTLPMPDTFLTIAANQWGLYAYIEDGDGAHQYHLLLDTWEAREDRVVSGDDPTGT